MVTPDWADRPSEIGLISVDRQRHRSDRRLTWRKLSQSSVTVTLRRTQFPTSELGLPQSDSHSVDTIMAPVVFSTSATFLRMRHKEEALGIIYTDFVEEGAFLFAMFQAQIWPSLNRMYRLLCYGSQTEMNSALDRTRLVPSSKAQSRVDLSHNVVMVEP